MSASGEKNLSVKLGWHTKDDWCKNVIIDNICNVLWDSKSSSFNEVIFTTTTIIT